jgi:hypothetical protein
MNSPNYRDFYPKALIPIGLNDQRLLLESYPVHVEPPADATHWLVALEGELAQASTEYYHWKICIYPCDLDGTYDWEKPYYASPAHDCIHKAFDSASTLEAFGRNDELCTTAIQEKIS